MTIDFIAAHRLQALCGESTFRELKKLGHDCYCLIGSDKTSGADAVVMLDHTGSHPGLDCKYKFFLPHDLGDIYCYEDEAWKLKDYNAVFAPGAKHYEVASRCVGAFTDVMQTNWTKYDIIGRMSISLPHDLTVLYCPTNAGDEWRKILPMFANREINLILKNHIYIEEGGSAPLGFERQYQYSLRNARKMEAYVKSWSNVHVMDRGANLCDAFLVADLLITDQSGAAVEFLPFGPAIETGNRLGVADNEYENSRKFPDIIAGDLRSVCRLLKRKHMMFDLIDTHASSDVEFSQDNGKKIADHIDKVIKG